MTEAATIIPICDNPAFGGVLAWGETPPADAAGARKMYTTTNPKTGGGCIWSWEHMAWFELAAVRVGESRDDRLEALQRENDTLREANEFLTKEANHWKANHACRVEAARMLIERLDMPLERIGAYRQHLAALNRAAHLEEELAEERNKRVMGQNTDLLLFRVRLEEYATRLWKKHYRRTSEKFEPADTADGLLSQIDNMICGLRRVKDDPTACLLTYPEREPELVAYDPEDPFPERPVDAVAHELYEIEE